MGDVAISFGAPSDVDLGLESGIDEEQQHGAEGAAPGVDGERGAPEGEPGSEDAKGPFKAVENGRLSPKVAEALKELKAKDPRLAREIQQALFAKDRLFRELPEGFKAIATMRQTIEQFGGDAGIQDIQQEISGWRDFDEKWTAGDPKVLEFLTGEPGAQDAFLKIFPSALDRFRELHPDGYNSHIAKVMEADLSQQEIPITVRLLGDVLSRAQFSESDKASAQKLFETLAGYLNRVSDFARKEVAAPASAAAAKGSDPNASRSAELDTREQALTRQDWQTASNSQHSSLFLEHWNRLVKPALPADKTKAQQATALMKRIYPGILEEKLRGKKDFNPTLARFFSAKDRDGFLRTHKAAFSEAVPQALRSAMAEVGIGRTPNPRPANGQAGVKPGEKPKPGAIAEGYSHVAAKPNMAEVNKSLTGTSMWLQKKAILKSGKRVQWD